MVMILIFLFVLVVMLRAAFRDIQQDWPWLISAGATYGWWGTSCSINGASDVMPPIMTKQCSPMSSGRSKTSSIGCGWSETALVVYAAAGFGMHDPAGFSSRSITARGLYYDSFIPLLRAVGSSRPFSLEFT